MIFYKKKIKFEKICNIKVCDFNIIFDYIIYKHEIQNIFFFFFGGGGKAMIINHRVKNITMKTI